MPEKKTTTKKPVKKTVVKKTPAKKTVAVSKYLEATGRRKTAVARVRIYPKGSGEIVVNDKNYTDYFQKKELQEMIISPFDKMNIEEKFKITVKVRGGGINAQAEAIRHGVSRALVMFDEEFKRRLRKIGYLTRDPRMKERKKFGLKRARKAPQWSKR